MKSANWSAFAAAVTGCAIAVGLHVSRPPSPALTTVQASKRVSAFAAKRNFYPAPPPLAPERTKPLRKSTSSTRERALTTSGSSQPGTAPVLTEAQWRAQATQVEMEANHELDRLVALLDLDTGQQGKAFSILARQSAYWLPGMKTTTDVKSDAGAIPNAKKSASTQPASTRSAKVGSPPGNETSIPPDLAAVLSPDQQALLIQEEMDRQAWWAEVLPQLLPPVIPTVVAAPLPVETGLPPENKVYEGGDVLLEE